MLHRQHVGRGLLPSRDPHACRRGVHVNTERAMTAFGDLSMRGQLGRLRRLAEEALVTYGLTPEQLVELAHLENTTFRVDVPGGDRYVLRIHRTGGSLVHPPRSVEDVRSETTWLTALRREARLAVPE